MRLRGAGADVPLSPLFFCPLAFYKAVLKTGVALPYWRIAMDREEMIEVIVADDCGDVVVVRV